jgi:hypothetical protein
LVTLNVAVTPPAQRVQFILGEDVDDGMHEPHPLFAEMGELVHDGNEMEWKETARYLVVVTVIYSVKQFFRILVF